MILVLNGTSERVVVDEGYMEGIVIKHAKVEKPRGPKLLLIGGSNLAFGVDSEFLGSELEVPVVNMGLHAGLGASFILKEMEDVVIEGDVIVLSFEYFLSMNGRYTLKDQTRKCFPKAGEYFTSNIFHDASYYFERTEQNWKVLFSPSNNSIKQEKKDQVRPIYSSSAFNDHGDVVSHLDQGPEEELNGAKIFTAHYWEGIDAINEAVAKIESSGATVFYMFPAFPQTEYLLNKKNLQQLEADIKRDLNIPVLNDLEDAIYPNDRFYDTVYHLNATGREQRTNDILKALNEGTEVKKSMRALQEKSKDRT